MNKFNKLLFWCVVVILAGAIVINQVNAACTPPADVTTYNESGKKIQMQLNEVKADAELLTVDFKIQGFVFASGPDSKTAGNSFENAVCDPIIKWDKSQLTRLVSKAIYPTKNGYILSYQYQLPMQSPQIADLHAEIVIGPCGPYFTESNLHVESIPLTAKFVFED
jgi:hypothetical protein